MNTSEYDYIDEDNDPNKFGILNHRVIAFLAFIVKIFPLYSIISINSSVTVLQTLYHFLVVNSCSDKLAGRKFQLTLDKLNFWLARLHSLNYLLVFQALFEVVALVYRLEKPKVDDLSMGQRSRGTDEIMRGDDGDTYIEA